MIQKTNEKFFIVLDTPHARKLVLKNGEIVTARIISKKDDTTARIHVRGFSFTAHTPASVKQGQIFRMLVQVRDNQLVLTPLLPNIAENEHALASQLSQYPDSALAETMVKNFLDMHAPLDFTQLAKLYTVIERTIQTYTARGKNISEQKKTVLKKRMSFLLTCFQNNKIPISSEQLEKLYTCIFEFQPASGEPTDKAKYKKNENRPAPPDDIITAANHLKGGRDFHWVLIPFEKKFDQTLAIKNGAVKGLAAFLLNVKTQRCVKTVIRANAGAFAFLFELENGTCSLSQENGTEFSPDEKARFLRLLQNEMKIHGAAVQCRVGEEQALLKELNIRV